MPVDGLDAPCSACEKTSGDHSLREWVACHSTSTVTPFEHTPPDAAQIAAESIRERFNLPSNLIVADHVIVRAAVLDASSDQVTFKFPVLVHEFQIGVDGQPFTVAEVAFLAPDTSGIRGYGKLVREAANGAADAVES